MECSAPEFLEDFHGWEAFSVIVVRRARATIADQFSLRAAQMRDDGVDFKFPCGASANSDGLRDDGVSSAVTRSRSPAPLPFSSFDGEVVRP
jgi:hypothetical protein